MKILCLHGYRQCGRTFREKSGAFRKAFKLKCEFVFVDGPNKVEENINNEGYAWWFSTEDNYFDALDSSDCNKGFDKSLESIKTVFRDQGPFDGILAFSQGAAFLQIILHMLESNSELAKVLNIKFAILVASFHSKSTPFFEYYKCIINTPCLLIYGNSDKVIPSGMTIKTFEDYHDKVVINHEGGHYMPMNVKIKESLSLFLSRFTEN